MGILARITGRSSTREEYRAMPTRPNAVGIAANVDDQARSPAFYQHADSAPGTDQSPTDIAFADLGDIVDFGAWAV